MISKRVSSHFSCDDVLRPTKSNSREMKMTRKICLRLDGENGVAVIATDGRIKRKGFFNLSKIKTL